MDALVEWIRKRVTASALSAASALIVLKLILPGIFDFLIDLMVLGLIWIVGYAKDTGPRKPPDRFDI